MVFVRKLSRAAIIVFTFDVNARCLDLLWMLIFWVCKGLCSRRMLYNYRKIVIE